MLKSDHICTELGHSFIFIYHASFLYGTKLMNRVLFLYFYVTNFVLVMYLPIMLGSAAVLCTLLNFGTAFM